MNMKRTNTQKAPVAQRASRRRRAALGVVANERAGLGVGFFVAREELFEDLHRGIDRFVGLLGRFLDFERVVRNVYNGLERLAVSVRPFVVDDELCADDSGCLAIAEFISDMLEFGGDVFLDRLAGRIVADLNSDVHSIND